MSFREAIVHVLETHPCTIIRCTTVKLLVQIRLNYAPLIRYSINIDQQIRQQAHAENAVEIGETIVDAGEFSDWQLVEKNAQK